MRTTRLNLIGVLIGLVALSCSQRSLCQGFVYGNTGVSGAATAGIYGPDPANPNRQQWGNTPQGQPPGPQVYGGAPLAGTNYSVQAWYSLTPLTDGFQLVSDARPVALSSVTFTVAPGYFPGGELAIPGALINTNSTGWPYFAYLQVRAWDNAGGQLDSWEDAWNAALGGSGRAVGWSEVFYQGLTSGLQPRPGMENFESFNIFIVPEPGTVSLLVLGGAALFWRICCRHRHKK
jgi:hypothetical protein